MTALEIYRQTKSFDSYEEALTIGREILEELADYRWLLGDLVAAVGKKYGEDKIGQFARDLGGVVPDTLRRYRHVAQAYTEEERQKYSDTLDWSHYSAVHNLPDRMEWLERAYVNSWTVRDLCTVVDVLYPKEGEDMEFEDYLREIKNILTAISSVSTQADENLEQNLIPLLQQLRKQVTLALKCINGKRILAYSEMDIS